MNNFNNIPTKTEGFTTLQGGYRKFRKWGGGDLLDTCKLYITENSSRKNCKFSQIKGGRDLLRRPQNPTHALFTLKHYPFPSFTCC